MLSKENQKYRSWVEVDLGKFAANWKEIRRLVGPGIQIMQVVKADAYGHGAIEISNAALKNGASCLGVANADEGVQLRVSEITAPVVILSPATVSEIDQIIKYDIIPSVSDLGFAREFQKRARKAGIRAPLHIEVDTGMGRGGTLQTEALQLIQEIASLPNLVIEGIFTHFSESEILSYYNDLQWSAFRELLEKLESAGIRIPIRHIANSGAILNYPGFRLDMVRPGIMTYGIYPSPETRGKASLSPVMSFKTRVILVKDFPEGYGIGYGRTFITRRPTRIATIPVGYGDGFGWLLGNQGEALVRGKRASIAGRVSMDMCTLDISHIPECQIGDEVVLMGKQNEEQITSDQIAAKLHTISYEILCALGKRAPRVFLNNGRADRVEPSLRRIFIPDEEKSIARIDSIVRQSLAMIRAPIIPPWSLLIALMIVMSACNYYLLPADYESADKITGRSTWSDDDHTPTSPDASAVDQVVLSFPPAEIRPAVQSAMATHQPGGTLLQSADICQVVGNRRSKRYHLPGMPFYDKIPSERRIIFPSENAAIKAGYIKGRI